MTDTVETLRRARDYLAKVGLWKGSFSKNGGVPIGNEPCCILAAIILAEPVLGRRVQEMETLRSAIGGRSIMDFNDRPETTLADALAAFDRAIAAEGGEA